MSDVYLNSDSLFSKFGFCDGDVLDDWMFSHTREHTFDLKAVPGSSVGYFGFEHALLIRLVRKYLLTVAPRPIRTYTIGSIHNPIRAEDDETNDFFVEVRLTYDQVEAEAVLLAAQEMV
ncbi:MAG: hypothetical protein A2139_07810 [Desulfobacca sp. RBG_16_60_12]|nr:MAG: hypothetical protein A2139_07810 [Desulfobacca sp. RBG_16_60_12]